VHSETNQSHGRSTNWAHAVLRKTGTARKCAHETPAQACENAARRRLSRSPEKEFHCRNCNRLECRRRGLNTALAVYAQRSSTAPRVQDEGVVTPRLTPTLALANMTDQQFRFDR